MPVIGSSICDYGHRLRLRDHGSALRLRLEFCVNMIPTATVLVQPGVPLVSATGERLGVCHRATIVFSAASLAMLVLSGHGIAQTNARTQRSTLELKSSDTR